MIRSCILVIHLSYYLLSAFVLQKLTLDQQLVVLFAILTFSLFAWCWKTLCSHYVFFTMFFLLVCLNFGLKSLASPTLLFLETDSEDFIWKAHAALFYSWFHTFFFGIRLMLILLWLGICIMHLANLELDNLEFVFSLFMKLYRLPSESLRTAYFYCVVVFDLIFVVFVLVYLFKGKFI